MEDPTYYDGYDNDAIDPDEGMVIRLLSVMLVIGIIIGICWLSYMNAYNLGTKQGMEDGERMGWAIYKETVQANLCQTIVLKNGSIVKSTIIQTGNAPAVVILGGKKQPINISDCTFKYIPNGIIIDNPAFIQVK